MTNGLIPRQARLQQRKGIGVKVLSSTQLDSVVGKIRNNLGSETADITIPESRDAVIKKAIEQEFVSQGYTIDAASKNALVVRINQLELELAQEDGKAATLLDVKVIWLKLKKKRRADYQKRRTLALFESVTG